jgi:hypothetical protein
MTDDLMHHAPTCGYRKPHWAPVVLNVKATS